MTCVVPSCKNIRRLMPPNSEVTFHRFPAKLAARILWFSDLAMKPPVEKLVQKQIYICSDHFDKSDFIVRVYHKKSKTYLREDARPKLFCRQKTENPKEAKLNLVEPQTTENPKQAITKLVVLQNKGNIAQATPKQVTRQKVENPVESLTVGVTNQVQQTGVSGVSNTYYYVLASPSVKFPSCTLAGSQIGLGCTPSTMSSPLNTVYGIIQNVEPPKDVSQRSTASCSRIDIHNPSIVERPSSPQLSSSSATVTASENEDDDKQNQYTGPKKRYITATSEGEIETEEHQCEPPKKRTPLARYPGDIHSDDFTSSKAKRIWTIANKTLTEQRKKIQHLQQTNRRLRNRVNCLNSLLAYLKDNSFITVAAQTDDQESLPESAKELLKDLLKEQPTDQI